MSMFDEERKQMGLPSVGGSSSSLSNGESIFANERARQNTNDFGTSSYSMEDSVTDQANNMISALDTADGAYSNQVKADNEARAAYQQRADEQALSDEQQMAQAQQTYADMPKVDEYRTTAHDLPVIGPVLRGLDAFSENPTADKVAGFARSLYTPGASLGNIGAMTGVVERGLGRIAPNLGSTFGGRLAQEAIKEGTVGVPLGAGQSLASGNPNLEDAAKAGVLGGGLGAAGGVAMPILGRGIQAAENAAARGLGEGTLRPIGYTPKAVAREVTQDVTQAPMVRPKLTGNLSNIGGSLNVSRAKPNEPANLDELVRSRGYGEATPETIAQTFNDRTWYHGTGTDKLTAETLDPFVGSHESLFGQGVYLTDNPKIAEGYAKSRGKRGTPTIYESNVNVNRVLDLEKPVTPDVYAAIDKSVKGLDHAYESNIGEPDYFTNLIKRETEQGATPEQIITKLRQEVKDFSHSAEIPTSQFVEDFQDLAINLKQAGYDAITHTGGHRTGNEAHRVMIMLDPQNWHGGEQGTRQVTRFEPRMQPDQTKVNAVVGRLRNSLDDGYTAAAQEAYDLPNTMTHIATKTKRQVGGLNQLKSTSITNTIDDLYRTKEFDQVAEEVLGRKLKPSESTYTLALNSRGADMISNQSVLHKLVDSQGNVVGDSLKDVMKTVPRKQFKEFEDYLINKHAVTRMERGEKVFPDHMLMTPEKSAAKAAEYEAKYPKFADSAKKYYAYQDNLTKSWLVDTGIITREQFAKWKETNPYYVPNQRLFDQIEMKGPNRAKGGFLSQKNPVKGYAPGGSQRKIISPIESTIENTDKYIKTAKRNEVGQALLNLLEQGGEDLSAFARIVPDESPLNVFKILNEEGIDGLIAKVGGDWEEVLAAATKDPNRPASVTVMRNGKPVKIELYDVPLFEAMTALSPPQQNILLRWAAQATRMFKMLTTGYNPIFSLTRNVIRDAPQAFVNSKTTNNPLRFGADLVDSFLQILGNRELYQSFKNFGGGHSSSVASNRNLLAQSKRRVLPGNMAKNAIPKLFEGLENLNNAIESAPRLSEYKRTLKQGGGNYDSKIQGLFNANDVTVNFNKRGKLTREAEAIFPYLNASIQSLDKLARVYKENPGKAALKSILAITFPAMYLYSLNHDNPNYKQVSNREKDVYYLIPREDGTFFKLPKPQGAGVPFGSVIERVLRQWNDADPQAFKDFASTMKTNFTPPGIGSVFNNSPTKALEEVARDTIAGPVVGLASNKDFANRPIVPGSLQGLSPQNQYDERTSEVSKLVGKLTNSSPKQLDYLGKSYTGIIGQVGIPLTTKSGSLGDTLLRQVTTDPLYSNDITRDFYDAKDKLDMAERDFNQTGIKGKNYDDELRLEFGRASRDMTKWNKEVRTIQADKSLSATEQERRIREIKVKINDAATKLNDKAKTQIK